MDLCRANYGDVTCSNVCETKPRSICAKDRYSGDAGETSVA